MNTNQTKTRGRPKGSFSFTEITLAELSARFGPDQVVPVSRLFLEKGAVKPVAQPVPQPVAEPVAVTTTVPAVEMKLSE